MAFDNFTLRKYRVLKETPKGDLPGDIISENEDVGAVFLSVGIVERVPDDTPLGKPTPSPRGSYKRRDLVPDKR